MTANMPVISMFIETVSAKKTPPDGPPIAPVIHVAHEQGLEDQEPNDEAGEILGDQVPAVGQAEEEHDRAGDHDAGRVAGQAMGQRPDRLLPVRGDEPVVGARQRLATGEEIDEQPDRAGIGDDQGPRDLHHAGRRGVAPLVPYDEEKRSGGQDEPQQNDTVEHRLSPGIADVPRPAILTAAKDRRVNLGQSAIGKVSQPFM